MAAEYDVAISFAGENRPEAEQIATEIKSLGMRLFYDKWETGELWGRDLGTELGNIYSKKATYCIALISKHYVEKSFTNWEWSHALARHIQQKGDYILPVRLDDTEIPGLPPTVACLRWGQTTPGEIARYLALKLKGGLDAHCAPQIGYSEVIAIVDLFTPPGSDAIDWQASYQVKHLDYRLEIISNDICYSTFRPPHIDIKIENISDKFIRIIGINVKVESSVPNFETKLKDNYNVFLVDTSTFQLFNDGWGIVKEAFLSLTPVFHKSCKRFGSWQVIREVCGGVHKFNMSEFTDYSTPINVEPILREDLGISFDDFLKISEGRKLYGYEIVPQEPSNEIYELISYSNRENQMAVPADQVERCRAIQAEASTLYDHRLLVLGNRLCLEGDLIYNATDREGADRKLSSKILVYLNFSSGSKLCKAVFPPSMSFDVLLESNSSQYCRKLSTFFDVPPYGIERFLLRCLSEKSSSHTIMVELETSRGSLVVTKPIFLDLIVPRSASKEWLKFGKCEHWVMGGEGEANKRIEKYRRKLRSILAQLWPASHARR